MGALMTSCDGIIHGRASAISGWHARREAQGMVIPYMLILSQIKPYAAGRRAVRPQGASAQA